MTNVYVYVIFPQTNRTLFPQGGIDYIPQVTIKKYPSNTKN